MGCPGRSAAENTGLGSGLLDTQPWEGHSPSSRHIPYPKWSDRPQHLPCSWDQRRVFVTSLPTEPITENECLFFVVTVIEPLSSSPLSSGVTDVPHPGSMSGEQRSTCPREQNHAVPASWYLTLSFDSSLHSFPPGPKSEVKDVASKEMGRQGWWPDGLLCLKSCLQTTPNCSWPIPHQMVRHPPHPWWLSSRSWHPLSFLATPWGESQRAVS